MTAIQTTVEWVQDALQFLAAGYPGARFDPDKWRDILKTYGSILSRYNPEVVRRGVNKAIKAHPQWFPTIGQLADICDAEQRGWELSQNRQTSASQLRERNVPNTPPAQQQYIDEARDNPWECMARAFECESKARRLNGEAPTPPEIGAKRMAAIRALLAKAKGPLAGDVAKAAK